MSTPHPNKEPLGIFAKGNSAPYLRLHLENGTQMLLQYIHIHLMELSSNGALLTIHGPGQMVQIEGRNLGGVLLNLQTCSVNWLEKGKTKDVEITRIVVVTEEELEPG